MDSSSTTISWFIILLLSFSLCLLIKAALSLVHSPSRSHPPLPPGPLYVPVITTLLWLRKSFSEIEALLRTFHSKYGPIITLRVTSRPAIFVFDRSLAHRALIENGAVFSDRPKPVPTSETVSSNQHNISSAAYGPTWRALRRNLTSNMLHPSQVKSFSGIRKRVLHILLTRLKSDSESSSNSIRAVDHFQYAMFCVLVFMCFGERVDESHIEDIERVQRRLLLGFSGASSLNFWPQVTRILLRKRWDEFFQLRKDQEQVLVPLIREREKEHRKETVRENDQSIVSYVDTLLDLELPEGEGKRKVHEGEMVTLCSEFLNAGTDTTSNALQWIMANLVKYPHVQKRVFEEIEEVVGDREEKEVKEEDLERLPYLKAVILEGLRRHPPTHFVLPHAVTEDVVLNGYLVPKNGTVNFMVSEIGWDPKVWEDPMAFKPERFLSDEKSGVEGFDITGSKEIRMMPFGAGRRICPAYNLAILHLEYYVANLVLNFEWKAAKGSDVDLSEKQAFTTVMKNPLLAHISPRI